MISFIGGGSPHRICATKESSRSGGCSYCCYSNKCISGLIVRTWQRFSECTLQHVLLMMVVVPANSCHPHLEHYGACRPLCYDCSAPLLILSFMKLMSIVGMRILSVQLSVRNCNKVPTRVIETIPPHAHTHESSTNAQQSCFRYKCSIPL